MDRRLYLGLMADGDVKMDYGYVVVPFVAWLVAGAVKFIINSIKLKRMAFNLIGYGGLPSNHSAIVSSAAALVVIREGIDHPAVAIAMAVAFVVMLDANSLRKQVGKHAEFINRLNNGTQCKKLRERMGHNRIEIGAGVMVGVMVALIIDYFSRTTL